MFSINSFSSRLVASVLCTALVLPATSSVAYAQSTASQGSQQQLSQAQLAALVAPIALYPDSLVAQVLMASTYPVEVAEAYNWLKSNSQLKGNALSQALQNQTWDASVKSLVSFPPVLDMMGSQLSWTQNLGNAVLAQQKDVMASIQDLRRKAKAAGALKSNQQQTVSTQGSGSNQTIVIQPANPQVVYVPTYNPTTVYGGWPYPAYPPVSYYPPGYVAGTALLSFGVGMAVGAALWGGCHWGGGSLTVNNNTFNNFNRNTTRNWNSNNLREGTRNWQSDAQRRNLGSGGMNNARTNAERDQLRQNLSHSGWMKNDARPSGERDLSRDRASERPRGRPSGGEHFGGDRRGGFGDVSHARFGGGGDHFGGFGGARHFGGFRR